jgi:hypothetical protein
VNHCGVLQEMVEAAGKWPSRVTAEQAALNVVLWLISLVVLPSAAA